MTAFTTYQHRAMPKSKPPVPRKSSTFVEPDIDALAQVLADLALAALNGDQVHVDEMNRTLRQALQETG